MLTRRGAFVVAVVLGLLFTVTALHDFGLWESPTHYTFVVSVALFVFHTLFWYRFHCRKW